MTTTALTRTLDLTRRAACIAVRRVTSIVRQLLKRNGPVWEAVRAELGSIAAFARRRPRTTTTGVALCALAWILRGPLVAVLGVLVWWAVTLIPRRRSDLLRVLFHEVASVTGDDIHVARKRVLWRLWRFLRGKPRTGPARMRRVRPQTRIRRRHWTPLRVHGVPVWPGVHLTRCVITYPAYSKMRDALGHPKRAELAAVILAKLREDADDPHYELTWQPARCRVAVRQAPALPTGALPYAHQDLPWYQLPVGVARGGTLVTVDLMRKPHAIYSGTTGSGKTSCAMAAIAHLLRPQFADEVQVWLADPARLDFRWAADYVHRYAKKTPDMVRLITAARREADRRLDVYEQHPDWRTNPLPAFKGLVLVLEEFAVLSRRAKDPTLVEDVLDLAEMGRKTNVHLIILAQQPNAEVLGSTEARDQFEWNLVCSNPPQEHRRMLSSYGLVLPRTLNTPGRVVLVCGQTDLVEVHAFWLASPTTPGVSAEDRAEALRWLPDPPTPAAVAVEDTNASAEETPRPSQSTQASIEDDEHDDGRDAVQTQGATVHPIDTPRTRRAKRSSAS